MYSDYISINKNFQSSVSLDLDLGNESKIEEYIPTSDICDVMKRYARAVLGRTNEHATTLVGPYGKGKSFLLLALAFLFGKDKRTPSYKRLLEKIRKTDADLAGMLDEINKKNISLLPVVINSNYDNLKQAFLLALKDSLSRFELSDLIPNTVFQVCTDLLKKWKENPDFNNKVFIKCLEKNGINRDELERGLKTYSPKAYRQFETLYNCVTTGLAFNPLINNDVVKIYSDVNRELSKHGYSGMFIMFDEFSKFIESAGDYLMKSLKIIQDFAELSARSSVNSQINLCCVTHKSLDLFSQTKLLDNNAFKTVEGRFKEIKFNRSLEENYQIISSAIRHQHIDKQIDDFIASHKRFYDIVAERQSLMKAAEKKALFYGCYPINPITVYSLIQLSELVAQNERTLFTFLSDVDENSFNGFIHKNNSGLLNSDKLYDYFSSILKKDPSNYIRGIYYRAESALAKVTDSQSRLIIKSLAIILIISDFEKLPPTIETISLSLQMDGKVVCAKIENLLSEHLLRRNLINNVLSFATSNSKEIDDQIAVIKQTKLKSIELSSICNLVNTKKYLLPRRYNERNKITRFYRVVYLGENQLMSMTSLKLLKEERNCDGLVINVLWQRLPKEEILRHIKSINDAVTIYKIPKKPLENYFGDELIRLSSLKEILKENRNDFIVAKEVETLISESTENIQTLFDKNYFDQFEFFACGANAVSFEDCLSDVMENVFTKKIVFNNELANKDKLTLQYQKSVNRVVDWILGGKAEYDFTFSSTSPEATIKRSIVDKIDRQPDAREAVDIIKNEIQQSNDKKISILALKNRLRSAPFGIRRGVMALLLAEAITELSTKDNIVLYYKDREIELASDNIVKAVYSEEEAYSFGFSKGLKKQSDYVENMVRVFGLKETHSYRKDVWNLSDALRKFFVGLPLIIRSAQPGENWIEIDESILKYKNEFMTFSVNPFETVFLKAFDAFGTSDLDLIRIKITRFKSEWQNPINKYKNALIHSIKETLRTSASTSLKMGFNQKVANIIGNGNSPILSDTNKKIYKAAAEEITFDDLQAINALSFAALGSFVEDWDGDNSEKLLERINNFFNELSNSKRVDSDASGIKDLIASFGESTSSMGTLLKNNLESTLSEYGGSVSNEEKISILAKLIRGLM